MCCFCYTEVTLRKRALLAKSLWWCNWMFITDYIQMLVGSNTILDKKRSYFFHIWSYTSRPEQPRIRLQISSCNLPLKSFVTNVCRVSSDKISLYSLAQKFSLLDCSGWITALCLNCEDWIPYVSLNVQAWKKFHTQ